MVEPMETVEPDKKTWKKRKVTKKDLEDNPQLVDEGVKVGDTIELPPVVKAPKDFTEPGKDVTIKPGMLDTEQVVARIATSIDVNADYQKLYKQGVVLAPKRTEKKLTDMGHNISPTHGWEPETK